MTDNPKSVWDELFTKDTPTIKTTLTATAYRELYQCEWQVPPPELDHALKAKQDKFDAIYELTNHPKQFKYYKGQTPPWD